MKLTKNIKSSAIKVLQTKPNTIQNLIFFLVDQFEAYLLAILEMKGKIFFTITIKCLIIANKMVGIKNSTAILAFFIKTIDAIYENLWRTQSDEILNPISTRKNTSEINFLLAFINRFISKLIGILSNMKLCLVSSTDNLLKGLTDCFITFISKILAFVALVTEVFQIKIELKITQLVVKNGRKVDGFFHIHDMSKESIV